MSLPVQWAPDTGRTTVQHVGVDHGGAHIFVTEQFLNGTDIIPVFAQMCGKTVPKGVTPGVFCDPGADDGLFNRPLQQ